MPPFYTIYGHTKKEYRGTGTTLGEKPNVEKTAVPLDVRVGRVVKKVPERGEKKHGRDDLPASN